MHGLDEDELVGCACFNGKTEQPNFAAIAYGRIGVRSELLLPESETLADFKFDF